MRSIATADMYEPHGEIATRLWFLLPLRLYVGFYFLLAAIQKVQLGFLSRPIIIIEQLNPVILGVGYSHALYRAFYENWIVSHAALFVFLVVFGELLVGLGLFTGTLTRLACFVGIFMVINFHLAFDLSVWAGAHNTTSFAVIMLTLWMAAAGRSYGIDHYLRGAIPRWLG
ncbi:DoxX family membrane protein [bacterium]|nr:DoxX family membrane protein [bacterium]